MEEEKKNTLSRIWTAVGVILCVILLPILIINSTLLFKSFADRDTVPSFGGYIPMIVLSDSMFPEIEAGDLIICKTVSPGQVQAGDIISFYDPLGNGTSVVTHRIEEITDLDGKTAYRTKGDNNNTADQSLVPADKLVGCYTGKRFAGLGNAAMFMQTTTGLVVCVVIPFILLVGYDILRRRSYEKKLQADSDALRAELEQLRSIQNSKS